MGHGRLEEPLATTIQQNNHGKNIIVRKKIQQ